MTDKHQYFLRTIQTRLYERMINTYNNEVLIKAYTSQ